VQLNHAASSAGSIKSKSLLQSEMMEDGNGSTSSPLIVREKSSVSPTILYNESTQEEPIILPEMKMLPANYSQCEFLDLVDLIGMLSQILHMNFPIYVSLVVIPSMLTFMIARMLMQLMGINVRPINHVD